MSLILIMKYSSGSVFHFVILLREYSRAKNSKAKILILCMSVQSYIYVVELLILNIEVSSNFSLLQIL